MAENLLKIAKDYTSVKNFKSLDFNLKNTLLYSFSDAMRNQIGTSGTQTFKDNSAKDPQPPTRNFVSSGDLMEYPSYLNYLFNKYPNSVTYYPLGSNLYGYSSLVDSKESIYNQRIPYLQAVPEDISLEEYPSFYDGMSSYTTGNSKSISKFYTSSNLTTELSISTTPAINYSPYFMCYNLISSGSLDCTFYTENITLDKDCKYCLSFYIRKNSTYLDRGTVTVQCLNNNTEITGIYYSDSIGYSKTSIDYSDIWERVSYIIEGTSGTVNFAINISKNTKIGGFLLEASEQSSLYNEILINEEDIVYHPIAIKLQKGGANRVTESLLSDWTISFTKVGGQYLSQERIGNLIFTENLCNVNSIDSDDNLGNLTITYSDGSSVTKTFKRPNATSNFSTRRYTFTYIANKNLLEVYVTFNYKTLMIASISDNKITDSLVSMISSPLEYHMILGGSDIRNLCSATRYRDLVFIRKALIFSEILALEKHSLGISSGIASYEFTEVTRNSSGAIESTITKEDASDNNKNITYLVSSIFINKEK